MVDDTAVTRRFNLMRLLQARRLGSTAQKLAREMNVSDKTIRRDLKFLCQSGYRIGSEPGDRGSKIWEIKSWVLSFGGSALVLEPESLRDEIARELGQMVEAYTQARFRDGRSAPLAASRPEGDSPHAPGAGRLRGRRKPQITTDH